MLQSGLSPLDGARSDTLDLESLSGLCCVLHRLIKRRWCSKSPVRAGASSVCVSCRASLAPAAASMVTCARAELISAQVLSIKYMFTFLWDLFVP